MKHLIADLVLKLQVNVLVLGAGPTGLGAATRLQQHGKTDWFMIDAVSDQDSSFHSLICLEAHIVMYSNASPTGQQHGCCTKCKCGIQVWKLMIEG